MGKNKSKRSMPKNQVKKQSNFKGIVVIAIAVVCIFIIGSLFLNKNKDSNNSGGEATNTSLAEIVTGIEINKEEISATAKFYPYEIDGIKMEVLALKAEDGTIRTALNTCQVCYASGRGYYVQEGEELVCQNCGNRFTANMVGKTKGGCNPVPISDESISEDGTNIIIDKNYLDENKAYFSNWKTS